MHLSLKGNEGSLQAYYQFDKDAAAGTASGVIDASGNNLDGTTVNLSGMVYPVSPVPIGAGVSDSRSLTTSSTNISFDKANVTINFSASPSISTNIVISRIESQGPTGFSSSSYDIDNEYFIINEYGGATFTVDEITFGRIAHVSSLDGSNLGLFELYRRSSNATGDTWGAPTATASSLNAGSNADMTFSGLGLNSFSQFVPVNTESNSTLPVEWLGFEAERLTEFNVQLDWATATEQESDYFAIQRMLEKETAFHTLGKITAAGNSIEPKNYSYIDANAAQQGSYYRIKQVDTDGSFSYSELRYVEASNSTHFTVFPNPTSDALQLRLSGTTGSVDLQLRVVSAQGQIVLQQQRQLRSEQLLRIEEISTLSLGTYYLHLQWENQERSFPFIKQ